jgi:plasmid stabilization system protein ParE
MLNIIWSNLAIDDVSDNIYYLEKNWTEKEVERFNDKTEEVLEQLSKGNLNFKPTEHKNIFQVPIVKQITLFYKINESNIVLLRFWNSYQNPDNLILE